MPADPVFGPGDETGSENVNGEKGNAPGHSEQAGKAVSIWQQRR